jgi:predicted GNAT family acetyltransferase
MPVRHDAQARRFTAATDEGGEAYLSYEMAGDRMDIQHTIVPPESQGGGVGASLVQAAADHARAHHLRVIPTCPFADAWFRRHRDAGDLLVDAGEADAGI